MGTEIDLPTTADTRQKGTLPTMRARHLATQGQVAREIFINRPQTLRSLREISTDPSLRTQTRLAAALGVSQPFVSQAENGLNPPRHDLAIKWLSLLAHTADLSKLSAQDAEYVRKLCSYFPGPPTTKTDHLSVPWRGPTVIGV